MPQLGHDTEFQKALEFWQDKIAALERERDESRKWAEAQARFINKLEAENALLRKRLEPIEAAWEHNNGDMNESLRNGAYPLWNAIEKCMALKEPPESNEK